MSTNIRWDYALLRFQNRYENPTSIMVARFENDERAHEWITYQQNHAHDLTWQLASVSSGRVRQHTPIFYFVSGGSERIRQNLKAVRVCNKGLDLLMAQQSRRKCCWILHVASAWPYSCNIANLHKCNRYPYINIPDKTKVALRIFWKGLMGSRIGQSHVNFY